MSENPLLLKPGVSITAKVNLEDVSRILKNIYGLNCTAIKELNGYDDRNYHIKVSEEYNNGNIENISEDGYVLKIINSLDSKKAPFFQAQNDLLLYLNERNISCPKPIKTKNGEYYAIEQFSSGNHMVRLLQFITGSILHQIVPYCTNELFYETGKYIANLDDCLRNFQHSVFETHQTLWMLTAVPYLKQFLYVIQESKREMIEAIIEQFEKHVLSIYNDLEKGVIHGDFNEQNIVVEKINDKWNIKAVLDFGDCQFACYLFELAITMAYMMLQGKGIDIGGYVLAGYVSVRPLPLQELKLLKICIEARLCQSLVIGAYSSLQDPNNSYILVNSKPGWSLLEELWKQTDEKLLETWKTICEKFQLDIFK